jgi:hypothetical protein
VSIFAFVIDKVIEAFVFLQTNLIKIYRFILEVGVNVGKGILKGFIWAIQKILDAFGGLLVGVGNILGFVPQLIGAVFQSLADKAKEIPLIGGLLAKPAEAIAKGFDFMPLGRVVFFDILFFLNYFYFFKRLLVFSLSNLFFLFLCSVITIIANLFIYKPNESIGKIIVAIKKGL